MMEDINKYVTTNFNDNIAYIEKNHPELFSKLVALDNAIANGHYVEKYELTYENNSFDVVEKSTQKLLYAGKSAQHSKESAKNVDMSIEHDTFETFNEKNISDEDASKYESAEPFSHRLYGTANIINLVQKTSLKKHNLKYLNKYIFFGVGLGLHLDSIHKAIHAKAYLIIEDDLELFRLSLFTLNYKKIAKDSKLIFSVFEDQDQFLESASQFLENQYFYNHYIKFYRLLSHSDEKIQLFQSAILQQPHFSFHHSNLLLQYLKGTNYLKTDSFLHNSIKFDDEIFSQKPLLLLAAGPSLQKQKEWLKHYQNHFTILAVAATLPFLYKEDIKPDIVLQVDAYEKAQVHFSDAIYDFIKDAICIFSAKVPTLITDHLNKDQLFFFESGTNYKQYSLKPSAPCAGSTLYQLSLLFGAKTIYLLGLDLALDNTTGQTHIDTHTGSRKLDPNKDNYEHKSYEVEGNFQATVSTLLRFKSSIYAINLSTKKLKQSDQVVYNLGNGAKFLDTTPQNIDNVAIQGKNNKETLKNHLLSLCKQHSSHELNDVELANIEAKLKHALKIKNTITIFKDKKFKNSSQYLKKLIELNTSIIDQELLLQYELIKVLDTYFRRIFPYIFDFFNTDQKSEKEDIAIVNELFTKHIVEIVEYYHNSLYGLIQK